MVDFAAALLSFPPDSSSNVSPRDYDRLAREFVKEIDIKDASFVKAGGKQNILDLLNPAANSLSYLFALRAQLANTEKDKDSAEQCFHRFLVFCTSFDAVQVRYAGTAFREVLSWALDYITLSDKIDVSSVIMAMLRLDPAGSVLTSTHLLILRSCLAKGVPSQALPLLDCNVYAFPQKVVQGVPEEALCGDDILSGSYITADSGFSASLKIEFVLEYYLLAALVYIGRRNYSRARLYLEHILLAPSPSHAHSAFQIEAYKRWVLIGLLSKGVVFPVPRTHDQVVFRSIRAASKPYDAIAEDFEKRDWRKLQAEISAGQQIWQEDGNQRLVEEVANGLLRFRVLDLQKTYAAIPVDRIAKHLSLSADDTLQALTDMIHNGRLDASITPSTDASSANAVLRFHVSTSSLPAPTPTEFDLEAQAQRIQELTTNIRDADRRLQLTKEYVEVQRRQKRAGPGPEADPADQMDLTWDPPIPHDDDGDEDLMEG